MAELYGSDKRYKDISINKQIFRVNNDEYKKVYHEEYNNLNILDQLGFQERQISLLKELSKLYNKNQDMSAFPVEKNLTELAFLERSELLGKKVNIKMNNITHGGFIPIKCSEYFGSIYINNNQAHSSNIVYNITNFLKNNKNIFYHSYTEDDNDLFEINFDVPESSIIVSLNSSFPVGNLAVRDSLKHKIKYELTNLSTKWTPQPTLYIYVPQSMNEKFLEKFLYIRDNNVSQSSNQGGIIDYDNLIHFCLMVKNGGPQLEDMLKKNMNNIDKWTILDTGSTDNTIETIHTTLVGKKDGELYQEPFINFRDSRNRCLDLAGTDCKFIIMMDDTYVIQGDLRKFLNIVRGDQFSDSYTLFIFSDDTEYGSNRIIKSESGLRYKYKIHEVINDKDNVNIVIPKEDAIIFDGRFDYMEERTVKRKELDLTLLYEELQEDPTNSRTYYYLAQTYNIMGQYEKAYEFFLKRASIINSGFIQERIDSVFEAARIANYRLNKPWEEFMDLYEKAYKIDESRPDSIYFMGINYYLTGKYKKAYEFFKKGFQIGYPSHCQYSLKPTLSFHFLPKFLTRVCYILDEYILGEASSLFFLQNNNKNAEDYEEMNSYYMIFKKLNEYKDHKNKKLKNSYPKKSPLFVFVADGGFNKWSGSNILTTGVGGSETYIIEMSRYIKKSGIFDVIVFCNCKKDENFEGVEYKHLSQFPSFVNENYVEHCMISRFTEYLPLAFNGFTENVYLVLHDLGPSINVISKNTKLKKIFCLTEWHVDYFTSQFPTLKSITVPFYYGIDFSKFKKESSFSSSLVTIPPGGKDGKEPFKFIYSSFPNRGLLPLLQMWPSIYNMNNKASLHIYTDVNGEWVNNVDPENMIEIRRLLKLNINMNIHYHGWVDKNTLAEAWLSSDIWFYPCIFMETFCLTALEAALTNTLVFTNDLAALQNTVGDRGIVIKGNPMEKEWQTRALEKIQSYFISSQRKDDICDNYRKINYSWASSLSWENQATKFLENYILPNKLEYKNLYGWYDDLPSCTNAKDIFEKMLESFNIYAQTKEQVKVLEIGSYTGISLINILQRIPNAIGYGVDMWSNYDEKTQYGNTDMLKNIEDLETEKSFYKNIKVSGLDSRMFGIKGDSHKVLMDMLYDSESSGASFSCGKEDIKNNDFDLVYIDGSHSSIDTYTDCYMSWKLLNKGGMMIIDDYLYNTEDDDIPLLNIKNKDILDHSPKKGIDRFLEKFKDGYKILNMSYRVFLEKL